MFFLCDCPFHLMYSEVSVIWTLLTNRVMYNIVIKRIQLFRCIINLENLENLIRDECQDKAGSTVPGYYQNQIKPA